MQKMSSPDSSRSSSPKGATGISPINNEFKKVLIDSEKKIDSKMIKNYFGFNSLNEVYALSRSK